MSAPKIAISHNLVDLGASIEYIHKIFGTWDPLPPSLPVRSTVGPKNWPIFGATSSLGVDVFNGIPLPLACQEKFYEFKELQMVLD